MTYLQLSAVFLAVAAVTAVTLALVARQRPHLGAVGITAIVLVLLTAVFDTVMIGAGLFHYSSAHLLGVYIGLAPLEDFAYPLAGVVLLPAVWTAVRALRTRTRRSDAAKEHRP
ncbi:lycopene cyclase domain-containing protein [Microbacterium sp. p3-SID336]|uniref:lycopene cyclase domain-containing protein n=1 Tax=Microbacterium sp. p3-SID336 TaxID=2916212 RepID=UPI0021A706DA|nr:lycopene cyclase domain-containing protein [Microbacterium sp. p3-SID336]MCT1479796.1 lycopene cyclase domain-containing protein [Microbacterium sp. p3-SID336]